MAVAFKAEHTRTAEYRFLPEKISIKPELNGRHDLPDIEWLKNDILARGQVQPVTIRKDGDSAVLVAGFSRWRAVSELNKGRKDADKIQLRCTYVLCSESEAFCANIAENRFRNSTTPLDDAHNIKRLLNKYAMTEERVADFYFPTAKTKEEKKESLKFVRDRVALIDLAPEAEQALKDGRIKPTAAKAIAKLSQEQQKEAVKGEGQVKASAIREASGKPKPLSLRERLKEVINNGWFPHDGNQIRASDELLDFIGRLVG